MLRYTIAVRGPGKNGLDMSVEEKVIDITRGREQFTEQYLCDINPRGQVPVLTGPALQRPMPDSVKITEYLISNFPRLAPEPHSSKILDLIKQLHSINFFSLTFTGQKKFPEGAINHCRQLLEGDISARYRKALEDKIAITQNEKLSGLEDDVVDKMVERARSYLQTVQSYLSSEYANGQRAAASGQWLFGMEHPTALDAHLVTFIVRLHDVKRGELVPATLNSYCETAKNTPEWNEVMQGRATMP